MSPRTRPCVPVAVLRSKEVIPGEILGAKEPLPIDVFFCNFHVAAETISSPLYSSTPTRSLSATSGQSQDALKRKHSTVGRITASSS